MTSRNPLAGSATATSMPAPLRPVPLRKGEARPVPLRSAVYDHLDIDALRGSRLALGEEEGHVTYLRRVLQAKLDAVRAGDTATELDTARLRPLLTSERVGAGRQALVDALVVDDLAPLPGIAELWDRPLPERGSVEQEALEHDLLAAGLALAAYRELVQKHITSVTGELIARYRERPDLCLSVLPVARGTRSA